MSGSTVEWPAAFERTPPQERTRNHNYEVERRDAVEDLATEMDRLGVDDWTLDTALDHQRQNPNLPYADQPEPDDPSVVVRWTMDGDQFAVACDRHSRVRDNLRTIGLYIREKRLMEQRPVVTGASEFTNARLPSASDVSDRPAHEVLDVAPDADRETIEAAFRERVKAVHPDHGGSADALREVRAARDRLLDERAGGDRADA